MICPKPDKVHKARSRIAAKLYAELMERAGGCCESCGKAPDFRGLALHHRIRKKMGGSKLLDMKSNLWVLCGVCHSREHGIPER